MLCTNCGQEIIDGAAFCTNCGTAVSAAETVEKADNQAVEAEVVVSSEEVVEDVDVVEATIEDVDVDLDSDDAAEVAEDADAYVTEVANAVTGGIAPEYEQMVESLEAAVQANEEAAGAAAAVGAAGAAVAGAQASQASQAPEPPQGAQPAGYTMPFYQQGASPNAHYSSQRSYEQNAYGQNTGEPGQPGQAWQQAQQAARQVWPPQSATKRAFMMTLYVSGLIGLIICLLVRDQDDEFITHHLNNNVVLCIGFIISALTSMIFIGMILGIYLLVMVIMGIVSAYNGDMNELPLIGKIHIVK